MVDSEEFKLKFTFGDIVVVEKILIGVVVKCWNSNKSGYNYDIYVREYNIIKNYSEENIERYMVCHKYLSEEEQEYQFYAINGL